MMEPWNPRQINPSLLTLQEYYKVVDEDNKSHPDSAYDVDLNTLQTAVGDASIEGFKLISQFTRKGIRFKLMAKTTKHRYAQRDPNPDAFYPWLRDENGKILYYTDAEIAELGLQKYEYNFRIYDEQDRVVGSTQDEWGTMLIMTASEYRGFGLGTILGKIARTYEPAKESGGFTAAGARNFARVHREFVRDALTSGLYSRMLRSGEITMARIKDIIRSARLERRPTDDGVNLASNAPSDWVLFTDFNGFFVLYDRKLKDVIGSKYENNFAEKMIKGAVYAMPHESAGITRIKMFGADSIPLKSFMLGLAYTYAKMHELPLWVEKEEYDLKGFTYGPEEKTAGYSSREVTGGKMIDYRAMVDAEIRFRRPFDKYEEFKNRLMEMAYSKY